MGTFTLRPDGTQDTAAWSVTGAATHHVAHSDNSDASYSSINIRQSASLSLQFGTSTVPGLAQIRTVTPRVRGSSTSTTADLGFRLNGPQGLSPRDAFRMSTAPVTHTGTARATKPDGTAWSQSDIDSILLWMDGYDPFNETIPTHYLYESYIDVVYNEAPVVAVTGPAEASTITNTSQPTVTWTYSDPESNAQERYRLKVFTAAQYGAGGFDPETSTATWDSGEVLSASTSRTVDVLLSNDTYRVYAKAADVGSSGRYSNWDHNTFTLNVTPPPVPSIVTTAQPASARVKLDVTEGGTTPATEYYLIQFSDDSGTTWVTRRGNLTRTAATTTTYDYESPSGVARQYRAAAVRTVSGQPIVSAYSTTATATLTVTAWWLVDPLATVTNLTVHFHEAELVLDRPESQAVFRPLGRIRAVVQAGSLMGEEGELVLSFLDAATYATFETLRGTQRTLFLQTPLGLSFYVRFGAVRRSSLMLGGQSRTVPKRIVKVSFVEVDRPV